jgi:hypothetical protein
MDSGACVCAVRCGEQQMQSREMPCYKIGRAFLFANCVTISATMARRWTVRDRWENQAYLTDERWEHIIDALNHPEMEHYETQLQETIRTGTRKQDPLNSRKYRSSEAFSELADDNTHIVAIVIFAFVELESGQPSPNNYIVTAFQKEIG